MPRFDVTSMIEDLGTVCHRIKAKDHEAAKARMEAAHPDRVIAHISAFVAYGEPEYELPKGEY